MRNSLKLIVVVMAALATVMAIAQPGGGGQRQGGQGGMRMMRMGGGGGDNPMFLLMREDVKDDIGITTEQNRQLKDLQDGMRDRMMSAMQEAGISFGGGQRPDRTEMEKVMAKVTKAMNDDLAKILKPEQVKRLGEIDIQLAGNRAATREKVQKELGLSTDQVAKIKKLSETAQQARQSVMEKARNREIEFSEIQAINEKNDKILDDEIGKVLTDANKAKLKEMGGKKFEAKENDN